ncbi:MAG: gamma-glutamyltransferase [Candidatus Rokuibacteriota bacterium]
MTVASLRPRPSPMARVVAESDNAIGRSPYGATIEAYRRCGHAEAPLTGPLAVTVPGALDGWTRGLERYAKMRLSPGPVPPSSSPAR